MVQYKAISHDQDATNILPRLRLPQRGMLPLPASPPAHRTPENRALADLPTRPALPHYPHRDSSYTSSSLPLQVGVGWNPGITRQQAPNEDGIVVLQGLCTFQERLIPFSLFVVADGMGGHEGGLEAAHIATRGMMHTVLQTIMSGNVLTDEYLMDVLIGGVEWANMAIYQRARELKTDMGTTITAALVLDMKAYVVNVGDSRTYIYRDKVGLTQITRDHSLVASLVTLGQIKPDEIYTHPDRHKIYRSLGQRDIVKIDWFIVDLCPSDRLLLCSDGLWEMVRDPLIEQALGTAQDATQASDRLVQMALRGGGADNVSALVAYIP